MVEDRQIWRNWAGNQHCAPARIVHPSGTDEISSAVAEASEAGRAVKVVGSGHSLTGIACTDGTLIQLDRHVRLLDVDRQRARVRVQAGMTLATLNRSLAIYGLALPDLGDVEEQTVSGALSTGMHGTGAGFGCLATQVVDMQVVTGEGSVVELSPVSDAPALRVARVGLGAIGVISSVTLQCVPAFRLRAEQGLARFDEVIDHFDELADSNEHFELVWIPGRRSVLTKRNNQTEEPPAPRSRARAWFDDVLVANTMVSWLGGLHPGHPRLARRINAALLTPLRTGYIDRSDRVLARGRTFPLWEMEYGIARSDAVAVLREIEAFAAGRGLDIGLPLRVRVGAGDDIPLSMAFGRASCFVAVRGWVGQPCAPWFRGIEAIMDNVGGRPHWGKLHGQTAETLAPRYPEWEAFRALRGRFDPAGRFVNPYLDRVLGPVT